MQLTEWLFIEKSHNVKTWMNATQTLVNMEELAKIRLMDITAPAHLDTLEIDAKLVTKLM